MRNEAIYDEDNEISKIRVAKHFKSGVSDSGDYNIDLSEYTSKQAVVNDVEKYINEIIDNNKKTSLSDENTKKYILPEIEDRYKNESKEKITETLEELKSQKRKIDIETDEGWDKNFDYTINKINREV